jgi:hypothetical protein
MDVLIWGERYFDFTLPEKLEPAFVGEQQKRRQLFKSPIKVGHLTRKYHSKVLNLLEHLKGLDSECSIT